MLYAENMIDIMREFTATIEPWFCEMTEDLFLDVEGFTQFLLQKLDDVCVSKKEEKKMSSKLYELLRWKALAMKLLPQMNLGRNFVDSLELPEEPLKIMRIDGFTVFVQLSTLRIEDLEESKSENEIVSGFVLTKSLRKVRTKQESRDIVKAKRCEVNLSLMQVSQVMDYPEYVVKRVGKSLINQQSDNRLRREFKIQHLLTTVGHEGINQLVAYCEDNNSMIAVSVCAGKMDLLDSLMKHIKIYGESYCESRIRNLFRPAAEAFLIAHNMGIAHRDISLENLVVFTSEKVERLEVIDWGHACSSNSCRVPNPGPYGKKRYFSPELLSSSEVYDPFKSDVFSFGVCLFTSLTGQMPFSSVQDNRAQILKLGVKKLLQHIGKEEVLSYSAIDLLQSCLEWDPAKRASMREVTLHSFFDGKT